MATFADFVSAVNTVYRTRDGEYVEGTAPALMSIASKMYQQDKTQIRQTDQSELVEKYGDDIAARIRRESR